jgi:hypothetical protein
VPNEVKGEVRVIGQLPGWPFPVKEDATIVNPKAVAGTPAIFKLIEKLGQ